MTENFGLAVAGNKVMICTCMLNWQVPYNVPSGTVEERDWNTTRSHAAIGLVLFDEVCVGNSLKAIFKDHPIGYKNMVSQGRWFLVTGSVALKNGTFCLLAPPGSCIPINGNFDTSAPNDSLKRF